MIEVNAVGAMRRIVTVRPWPWWAVMAALAAGLCVIFIVSALGAVTGVDLAVAIIAATFFAFLSGVLVAATYWSVVERRH